MVRVVALRAVRLVVTLFVVTVAVAFMIDLLPGDPALHILGADYQTTVEQVEEVRERLGLNDPIHVRYWEWLTGALQGDLGWSYARRQPASEAIFSSLPVTIELAVLAQSMALITALVVAPVAASRRDSLFDQASSAVSFGLLSIPHFILGLVLIYLFAVSLGWLPSTGFVPLSEDLYGNLRSLFLPAVTLAAAEAAIYTRLLRSEIVNTLQEDYIALAKAKGLPQWWIMLRHVLRPSSFSLMTVAGLSIGGLIGGAVVVETIYSLPGIGRLAVDAIVARDFVVVQGVVALVTIAYVLINFVVDLLYLALDPRIRHAKA